MLIDEAEDLFDLPQGRGASIPQLVDERAISGGELAESRRRHPRVREKALDALQNLCLSDHEGSLFGEIQFCKGETLDTSGLEYRGGLCQDAGMSNRSTPKPASPIYKRLIALKPDSWTEAEWARRAGVSVSFFSDLKKKGTTPTIEKVERLVQAAGRSMLEYYGADRAPKPQDTLDAMKARDAAVEIFRALGRDEFQAELLAKYILSKSRMTESSEDADAAAEESRTSAVGAADLIRLLDIQ